MKNDEDDFKQSIISEAYALKIHATVEERGRLDMATLNGDYSTHCLYGQMTGSCFSERAHELIAQCAHRAAKGARRVTFSPIERYLFWNTANAAPLVAFIKGERETLTIEDL